MIFANDRVLSARTRRCLTAGVYLAALAGIAATQSGCEVLLIAALMSDDGGDDPPIASDTLDPVAPEVEIEIADWPPIGPTGGVYVHAASENGISEADLEFRNVTTLWADGGTEETFFATGDQLGEGFGDLSVLVRGSDGATTEAYVSSLLVDLTPPEIRLGPTTLPAVGASFDFWMGDAWVLSKAEISFGGQVLTEELPQGYPATLGTAWDYSLVRFDVADLPVMSGIATITVTDAAGNVAVEDVSLIIDGAPPSASFLAPHAGDEVRGTFEVEVEANDAEPGPVSIDLYAGGSIVATGNGPACTFVLSADELGAGPLQLEAVATDEAGNRSVAAHVGVVVAADEEEHPPGDGDGDGD